MLAHIHVNIYSVKRTDFRHTFIYLSESRRKDTTFSANNQIKSKLSFKNANNQIIYDHEEIYIEVTDTERYVIERLPYPVPYTFHVSQ